MFLLQGCTSPLPINHKETLTKTYFNRQQLSALQKHLAILSSNDMAGRKFASAESSQTQNYLISSLIKNDVLAFQGKYRHSFKHKTFMANNEGNNIIGYVEGTRFPDQFIVLSAHYDHLGKTGTKVYNGADDNASGSAALLAFGDVIAKKPLKYSVIFLFTDGEEINLLGAKAFVQQQQLLLPYIRLNMNLDMIAGNKNTKKLHYIHKGLHKILTAYDVKKLKNISTSLTIQIKRGFKKNKYKNMTRASWINASDHAIFNHQNIPFIYFGVGVHTNYHTPNDSFENINLSFYNQSCQSILHYLTFLDDNIIPLDNKNLTN